MRVDVRVGVSVAVAGWLVLVAVLVDVPVAVLVGTTGVSVGVLVGTSANIYTVTDAALIGDRTILLRVYGTGATVTLEMYVDGALYHQTLDTSADRIVGAGKPGIIGRYGGTGADATGVHIDTVRVGTLF